MSKTKVGQCAACYKWFAAKYLTSARGKTTYGTDEEEYLFCGKCWAKMISGEGAAQDSGDSDEQLVKVEA